MARPTPIYRVDDAAKRQLETLNSIKTFSAFKEWVSAVVGYANKHSLPELSRAELIEALKSHIAVVKKGQPAKSMPLSNSMISKRMNYLEEIRAVYVLDEELEVEGKIKKFNVYWIKDLTPVIKILTGEKESTGGTLGRPSEQQLMINSNLLTQSGVRKLQGGSNAPAVTQGAFTVLLSACRSRSTKTKNIKVVYKFSANDYVNITCSTSTEEGSEIMFSSDQRVIVALNGMLKRSNEEQYDMFSDFAPTKMIDQYCFFDIYELTREVGLQSNKVDDRERVRQMVSRLESTTFNVDCSNSDFWRRSYMPNQFGDNAKFRYITEFYTAKDFTAKDGLDTSGTDELPNLETRYYVVKFHPSILESMFTGRNIFLTHPSLKSDKLNLAHLINNWVKPKVGVSASKEFPKGHHKYALDNMGEGCAPAILTHNFERDFFVLVKRQDKKEDNDPHLESVRFKFDSKNKIIPDGVFWLNGYYFQVEMNEELVKKIYRNTRTASRKRKKIYPVVTVWRDKLDPIVGDNSDHNMALKRQLNELMDTSSPKSGEINSSTEVQDDLEFIPAENKINTDEIDRIIGEVEDAELVEPESVE